MRIYNPIDIIFCLKGKSYPMLSDMIFQKELISKIEKKEALFVGRLGMTEAYNMRMVEFGYKSRYQDSINQLCQWSGFFPDDVKLLPRFAKVQSEALSEVDYLLPLRGKDERYLIHKYSKDDVKYISSLDLWDTLYPWSACLKGKKVLVIHPFTDSIQQQYAIREKIFPNNPDILPDFQIDTLKAVQTIAGERDDRFSDWFEALDYMKNEITKRNFDIALIGCGAYGLPLGKYIKELGKIALHVGGVLQYLFGIKGTRWEEFPGARKLMNEYWIRPSEKEKPRDANIVENGCYW